MSLEIDLQGDEFILLLPNSDRRLFIPATPACIDYLKKIISDCKENWTSRDQPTGYIRNFPTQHVIDKWLKENQAKKEKEAEDSAKKRVNELQEKYGVDITKLGISL